MGDQSKIAWTDATWNPWIGCQRSSEATLNAPLRWNKKPWVCDECGTAISVGQYASGSALVHNCGVDFHRRRVFSLSLGDWLDQEVPIEWLADMLDVIRRCPNLDFLLLTKRPENWRARLNSVALWNDLESEVNDARYFEVREFARKWIEDGTEPENCWIGTTVEDQPSADQRIPHLLKIPATIRFFSVAPMLEAVDLGFKGESSIECYGCSWKGAESDTKFRFKGEAEDQIYICPECGDDCAHTPQDEYTRIDWVIVGGESGSGARPFNIEWARSITGQCNAAGVPVFVKQMGVRQFPRECST